MESEAQRRANLNYRKHSTHQLNITFYPADEELWEWLRDRPKAKTIKGLIRAEIDRNGR